MNNDNLANSVIAYDVNPLLPKLLERVAAGEVITITHGLPVARLVPAGPARSEASRREAIGQMRQLALQNLLGGLRIQDLVAEGRK